VARENCDSEKLTRNENQEPEKAEEESQKSYDSICGAY
jgi:hypothetical protein